jgi:putative DNA primase/helicase
MIEESAGVLEAPKVAYVRAERVRWLWPRRIPFGKVTVIDGDPGLGKSTAALDIAARVSTASPLPDGSRLEYPASVLVMSAEDAIADTIRPRLEAAGADLHRIAVFRAVKERASARPPELPGDLPHLESLIEEDDAQFVIVDPLMAFLAGSIDAHRDQDVRRALYALSTTAERTGVALLIIRHLNKAPGGSPLYRGGGSIGIIGAARAGLLVAPDPGDEKRRILASTKSNLSEKPASLAYRIVGDEEHDCARIVWEGTSDLRAEDLLNPPRETKRDAAAEFLESALLGGPVLARELYDLAEAEGISDRTLRRAKEELGVKAFRRGEEGQVGGGSWWWSKAANPLGGHPSNGQVAALITAGQSTSDPPSEVKVATSLGAGDKPFSATRLACEVCGSVTFYIHHDGRPLCPRHKPS